MPLGLQPFVVFEGRMQVGARDANKRRKQPGGTAIKLGREDSVHRSKQMPRHLDADEACRVCSLPMEQTVFGARVERPLFSVQQFAVYVDFAQLHQMSDDELCSVLDVISKTKQRCMATVATMEPAAATETRSAVHTAEEHIASCLLYGAESWMVNAEISVADATRPAGLQGPIVSLGGVHSAIEALERAGRPGLPTFDDMSALGQLPPHSVPGVASAVVAALPVGDLLELTPTGLQTVPQGLIASVSACRNWANSTSWVPTLSESTQQKLEYTLPITLAILGWLLSYTWKGHAACMLVIVLHTIEVAVTNFGDAAATMRVAAVLTPTAHDCIDVCLISGLALTMILFPSEFGAFPTATSIALECTIPPYLLISFKTLDARLAGDKRRFKLT